MTYKYIPKKSFELWFISENGEQTWEKFCSAVVEISQLYKLGHKGADTTSLSVAWTYYPLRGAETILIDHESDIAKFNRGTWSRFGMRFSVLFRSDKGYQKAGFLVAFF